VCLVGIFSVVKRGGGQLLFEFLDVPDRDPPAPNSKYTNVGALLEARSDRSQTPLNAG
jgi:hypothetical protein